MDQSEIEKLTEEALWALRDGQNVRAVGIADQLIAAAPENAVARAIRAQALLKSDAGEDALSEARLAVELDPNSEHAQTILGIAAWRSARLTLAQQALERAIELSGGRPGLWVDYAWFMASERGPRPALEAAAEAVRVNAGSSTAWAALGLAQFRLHRRGEAEASLQRALKIDPNDPYAQSVMVTLLQDKRQDRKAVALSHLLEETPGTEDFVADVRQEAKQRQVVRKLVERDALPEAVPQVSVHWAVWPILGAVFVGLFWMAARPQSAGPIVACLVVPLAVVWLLRRIFG